MTRTRPLVIGHRGASGYRPEHTVAAYQLAFAQGADAVEPDLVLSRDGVLVVRHENEISATTDVADRSEFADRWATKTIDGQRVEGWFTEDFSWKELQTLRAKERRPETRPGNAAFDGQFGLVSFPELLALVEHESAMCGRRLGIVAELKHPSYFASIGLSLADAYRRDLAGYGWAGHNPRLVTECFESSVLHELAASGDGGRLVALMEAAGTPPDILAAGRSGSYLDDLTDHGLQQLRRDLDGISLERAMVLDNDRRLDSVVTRAHAAGLLVFCWTLRPENRYLTTHYRGDGADADLGHWQEEWLRILDEGVDGVFTDYPDLAVSLLD